MSAARTPLLRDIAWFVVLPLALAGAALAIQEQVRRHRTEHLWDSPAPPPAPSP
jgi:hypothetical protein